MKISERYNKFYDRLLDPLYDGVEPFTRLIIWVVILVNIVAYFPEDISFITSLTFSFCLSYWGIFPFLRKLRGKKFNE